LVSDLFFSDDLIEILLCREYYKCEGILDGGGDLVMHLVLGVCLWWLSIVVLSRHVWRKFVLVNASKFRR